VLRRALNGKKGSNHKKQCKDIFIQGATSMAECVLLLWMGKLHQCAFYYLGDKAQSQGRITAPTLLYSMA